MKKVFLALLFLGAFTTVSATDLEKKDNKNIKSSKVESFVKKNSETISTVSYDEVQGDCHIKITNNKTGKTVLNITVKTETADDCRRLLSHLLDGLNE